MECRSHVSRWVLGRLPMTPGPVFLKLDMSVWYEYLGKCVCLNDKLYILSISKLNILKFQYEFPNFSLQEAVTFGANNVIHTILNMPQRRLLYTYETRVKVTDLLKTLHSNGECVYKRTICKSISDLSNASGVLYKTFLSWRNKDWTKKIAKERLSHRGRKSYLNEDQTEELHEWFISRQAQHKLIAAEDIIAECLAWFEWSPTPSWVSKWASKNAISSQLAQKRPTKRMRDHSEEEVTTFRQSINDETARILDDRRRRTRVWQMDESGLFDDSVTSRSYSKWGESPSIESANSHKRDTVVACVSNDGVKILLMYICHVPKKWVKQKNPLTGECSTVLEDKGVPSSMPWILTKMRGCKIGFSRKGSLSVSSCWRSRRSFHAG